MVALKANEVFLQGLDLPEDLKTEFGFQLYKSVISASGDCCRIDDFVTSGGPEIPSDWVRDSCDLYC
jgi:hypothetical protein